MSTLWLIGIFVALGLAALLLLFRGQAQIRLDELTYRQTSGRRMVLAGFITGVCAFIVLGVLLSHLLKAKG